MVMMENASWELLRSEAFMRPLEEELPKVTQLPTLLLWGNRDFASRKRVESPGLERLFPNHETVVLDKAKHFLRKDAPHEAAEAIRRWFTHRRSH